MGRVEYGEAAMLPAPLSRLIQIQPARSLDGDGGRIGDAAPISVAAPVVG